MPDANLDAFGDFSVLPIEVIHMQEQFYTVTEAAEILKVSTDTATRLFANEPGVIDLGRPEKSHKRRYRVLRIPHAVFNRVIQKRRVQ
jgi:hypothetical protein